MLWESTLYRSDPTIPRGNASDARHISVHFPRHLVPTDTTSGIYYETTPDWYTATIPFRATPTDIEGCHIFKATSSTRTFESIPEPAGSFQDWIQQLPPAERRLISSHYFAECDAEKVLLQYLQIQCTLLIGTDGGKRYHSGSFSWIICSPSQEQLVLNAGPVDGWHRCQSSLRSEAAAIASLTLYVDELATYHQVDIRCKFCLYVDSTSAISTVQTLRDLIPKRRFPNHADILSTMSSAHYVIQHFILHHVHSHQDKQVAFDTLPFPAQLNVLCDTMATNQMARQEATDGERTLSTPLLPRTLNVEITYARQVVSSHYVARLRESISLDRHRTFLQAKYNWSDKVWMSISWDAFKTCARRPALTQPVTRSKLVHNWLNLGIQRAKFGSGGTTSEIERRCPYCKHAEDFTHMLTCVEPRALKFRYDATIPLRKVLSDAGDGGSALLRALKAWTLNPFAPLTLNPTDAAISIQGSIDRAMESQTQIGWPNFFRGFLSLDWGQVYSNTDTTPLDVRRQQSEKTLAAVIMAAQDYTLAIWRSRNAVLHESGSDSLDIVNAALNHSISQLYALQSTLSPVLRSYFILPLDDRLRRSPRQRKRWLRLARLATSHSSATGTRQQLLPTYFPHAPSTHVVSTVTLSTAACTTVPPILQQLPINAFFNTSCDGDISAAAH
jgi:hypothetical protein